MSALKNSMKVSFIKFIFSSLILFGLVSTAYSQERSTSKKIQVYVTKLKFSSEQLAKFINQKNGLVYKTDFSTNRYHTEFLIPIDDINALDSFANTLGYITLNVYNSENIQEKINQLKKQKESLVYENSLYTKQLADSVITGTKASEWSNKINNNLQLITSLEININQLEQNANDKMCNVIFTINDEMSTPNYSGVSFVNMPGIEYGYLHIENPKAGLSAKAYHGATIKYMFTRGKSYFNLGAYTSLKNNRTDSTLINELFLVQFGQDFYPRNFGRGKRKFLNLYTGYQLGCFITNQNNGSNSKVIPNANLSFGVELIKTKHILVDNKVSYFLPLDEWNRNLRGVLYHASFNFVF